MNECYSDVRAKAESGDPEAKEIMTQWFSNLLMSNKSGEPLSVSGKLDKFMANDQSIASVFNQARRDLIKIKGIE